MSDGSTFRIVSILPGRPNDRIECFFLEIPVTAQPKYSALSYAWGSPTLSEVVWIHGHIIAIGENLKDALHRLRDSKDVCNFWIDALCINQQDDRGEKSIQIPLMREIYSRAQQVVIFLGVESAGSDAIPCLLDRIDRAYDLCRDAGYEEPMTTLPVNKYELFELPSRDDQIWESFGSLLNRSWFTRIWVIQEVTLATSVELICGRWSVPWTWFLSVVFRSLSLGLTGFSDKPDSGIMGNTSFSIEQLIFLNSLKPGGLQFVPGKLIDLLHQARLAHATKPEDYCYGMIGLARELDDPNFAIDSSLPVETVYRQFARCFVTQGDAIKVLYNSGGHTISGLPSWVPDWSHRGLPPLRIVPPPHREPLTNPAVAAALSVPPSIRLRPANADIVAVRAYLFDTITHLGLIHHQVVETHTNIDILSHVANLITELQGFLREGSSSHYPSGDDHETIIWRTLICNHRRNSSTEAPSSYVDHYRAILFLVKAQDPTWTIPRSAYMESLTIEKLIQQNPLELLSRGQFLIGAMQRWCASRRRGLTKRGYVGQFCADARIGDVICIPAGSAVPFVIHLREKGMYEVIGECYVHGIMQGEAFRNVKEEFHDLYFV